MPSARRIAPCLALLALPALARPAALGAQIRASEEASISQVVDGTRLTVVYSRPRARGRSPLFGGRVVRWDEVWTPGANWATTLELDRDLKLDGHAVPKGKWSVWMVVRKSGDWTFVLDPKARRFHLEHPDSAAGQVRFAVRPESATTFLETLTWSVPDLRADGGTLAMQWGWTRVAMRFEVEPSLRTGLAAPEAQPYLGRYDFRQADDTTRRSAFLVSYRNGTLEGEWEPMDPYFKRFALIRIGPDTFVAGLYDEEGRIYEVLRPDFVIEFARPAASPARAASLEMRDAEDKVFGTARRRN